MLVPVIQYILLAGTILLSYLFTSNMESEFKWSYSFLPVLFELKQHIWTKSILWVLELTEEQPLH